MSLKLNFDKKVSYDCISGMFLPFSAEKSKLPFCEIITELAERTDSVDDSVLLNFYDKSAGVTIKEYTYYPFSDYSGAVIYNSAIGEAIAEDNGRRISLRAFRADIDPKPYLQMIMRMYQYTCIFAGAFLIHSAAVEFRENGILFCGVPGAGKSTQARLWEQYMGAKAINNDQPCVFFEDGKPFVHGSPWSGKEPCYRNVYYPAKAIVFVEQSETDEIRRVSKAEAFSLLYLNNYIVTFDNDELEEKYSSVINQIVNSIPVYVQRCTMTENAPKTLYKTLFKDMEI